MSELDGHDAEVRSAEGEANQDAAQQEPSTEKGESARENVDIDFSEDELSDLDEDQFENFDETKIGREADDEPTIYNLPSFRKKQHSEDIKPSKVESSKKERRARRGRSRRPAQRGALDELEGLEEGDRRPAEEELPMDPTVAAKRQLDMQIDAVLKPTRQKKRSNEDNIEQLADDEVLRLREQMRLAALRDAELNSERLPATEKLKMLPLVDSVLRKTHLYDTILDNNLLDSVRMWLEPLPDRSLPALNIQQSLLDILTKLPIETEHLRESKIGRKPEPFIKRIADRLVSEWSRPIIKRSANYRDRAVGIATLNPELINMRRRRDLAIAEDDVNNPTGRIGQTVIPRSIDSRYQVAPRVRLNQSGLSVAGRLKPADTEQVRKLKAKMKAVRSKNAKKSGVSIEGRGL
ncbi:transcription elongation factor complex subunit Iws1 [Schizosaccharomyces cryophilus OY26]|uniref:Transcription elongation factor complex subunit Iws1 n=1 Tax=Schizosaccharomyces cryophilus (strain OY26 / ATCC MYA-4695 / CBS 11777 / NBRC 106824 / NRRL Y48691) TaxID=653667 RepID=S9W4M9_SCHCR|nr:transcription elongation factor complex subunit Iws1 [Schizosaccharomyces cryophilus OY26]EPY52865.1 transcription elongation factor complex subunit Iws1 [Schizosaccharomyces cryophilus OY26]